VSPSSILTTRPLNVASGEERESLPDKALDGGAELIGRVFGGEGEQEANNKAAKADRIINRKSDVFMAWSDNYIGPFQHLVRCANQICIILTMDKEARKRIKEAIEKKNQARQKGLKERSSPSTQTKQRPGHTVRPEKKRG